LSDVMLCRFFKIFSPLIESKKAFGFCIAVPSIS
jgi:hypothetical protein